MATYSIKKKKKNVATTSKAELVEMRMMNKYLLMYILVSKSRKPKKAKKGTEKPTILQKGQSSRITSYNRYPENKRSNPVKI